MRIILLDKDDKYYPTAVIETETTTAQEIENIVNEVESTIDEYCFEDIEDRLPSDCKVFAIYGNEEEVIW